MCGNSENGTWLTKKSRIIIIHFKNLEKRNSTNENK